MFDPLPPRISAVDACADELRRRILGGELAAGSRLPPERDLAEMLGTSRVTVRSALARLADAQLVSVRQGSGYLVKDFRDGGGPDLLPGLIELARSRDLPAIAADLLLVRRQMAGAVLERLSQGVSAAQLERIGLAVDELEARAKEPFDSARIAEADVAIVASLLAATGSAVLQLCLNPILLVLGQMPELREAMYATPHANLAGWRMLIEWLKSGERGAIPWVRAELERRDQATLSRLQRKRKR